MERKWNEKRIVSEHGISKLIPDVICNPRQVYTISQGKYGMIAVFRLEPSNVRIALGRDHDC